MLDTLQKMSGVTHKSFTDSKTITRDAEKLLLQNEGKVSYTMNTKEVPVITYNDMAFISERNSIVFRAGDSPIWNRNETILPMSWRLFQNTITKPGKEFTLQTIPTLSSAVDFDVRKNQPDFGEMLNKRMRQANLSAECQDMYKTVYEYDDNDIARLDPDNYADEIMDMINSRLNEVSVGDIERSDEEEAYNQSIMMDDFYAQAEENTEQKQATAEAEKQMSDRSQKIYAGSYLSKEDLVSKTNGISHDYDKEICAAYREVEGDMQQDREYFSYKNNHLYSADGKTLYIKRRNTVDMTKLNEAAKDPNSNVYAEGDIKPDEITAYNMYEVTDDFYRFLADQPRWDFARGRFENEMAKRLNN